MSASTPSPATLLVSCIGRPHDSLTPELQDRSEVFIPALVLKNKESFGSLLSRCSGIIKILSRLCEVCRSRSVEKSTIAF